METAEKVVNVLWEKALSAIIGRKEVRVLLETIAGGKHSLTTHQFAQNRDVIMHAVASLHNWYEGPGEDKNYPTAVYFRPNWEQIEQASSDEEMVAALENLRMAIVWE